VRRRPLPALGCRDRDNNNNNNNNNNNLKINQNLVYPRV
jgi:hypothetical protein